MKISKITPCEFALNKKVQKEHTQRTNNLQQDCFQKSQNISFGNSFFDIFDFDFLSSITEIAMETRRRHNQELRIEAVIRVFSDKGYKTIFSRLRNEKVEKLFTYAQDFTPAIPLFKESEINTIFQMEQFVKTYNRAHQAYPDISGQPIEAVKISGILKNKEDLANYPELLLYLYNEEEKEDNPNFEKLNQYTEYLRQLDIKKFSEFNDKLEHLKPQYNDFESISDKIEAIEDGIQAYPKKISLLEDIVKTSQTLGSKSAEKIYPIICDIVDYYYDKNNGESLDDLADIIDLAVSQSKLKSQALRQLEVNKKELKSPEQKIKFLQFLKSCDVTIADFNAIATKSILESNDYNVLEQLNNKKYLSQCIQKIKACTKEEAVDFYRRFNDVINATYSETNGSLDNLKTIIEIAQKYNIKNSEGILRFYGDATGQYKKTISKQELTEFIELFQYTNSKNILEEAKRLKTKAINLLRENKRFFEEVKPEIEYYIQNDNSGYFTGESALTIFRKHIKMFKDTKESVGTILEVVCGKDAHAIEKQRKRDKEIDIFSQFFRTKDETINFINKNQISFNETDAEIEYKENCLAILEALYDEKDKDGTEKRIEFLTNSEFLLKSKNRLSDFLNKMPTLEIRKKVMRLITDKKVPSLNHLEKFFREYQNGKNSHIKLLNYLLKLPSGIDFEESTERLSRIQKKVSELYLPIEITADNIHSVNKIDIPSTEKIEGREIAKLMDRIYDTKEEHNFLTAMQDSTEKIHRHFSKYRIAEELVTKISSGKNSYQNLVRLLGIDRATLKIPNETSKFLYIEAVEKILPDKFVDFVNSNEWINFSDDATEKSPNIVLHARLRAIDRFALNNAKSIEELYQDETVERLKSLFKSVYCKTPIDVRGTDHTKRIITNHLFESNVIEAVFSPKGQMITIVQKSK